MVGASFFKRRPSFRLQTAKTRGPREGETSNCRKVKLFLRPTFLRSKSRSLRSTEVLCKKSRRFFRTMSVQKQTYGSRARFRPGARQAGACMTTCVHRSDATRWRALLRSQVDLVQRPADERQDYRRRTISRLRRAIPRAP